MATTTTDKPPNKVKLGNVAGGFKGKAAKAARLAKNSTRLSGCVQVFLEGLDALELMDEHGTSVTAKELKQFGVRHVQDMANDMDERMYPRKGKGVGLDTAMAEVLTKFEGMHREWFKAQKGYFLIKMLKLDEAYGLIKKNNGKIKQVQSGLLTSADMSSTGVNKFGLPEISSEFYSDLMGLFNTSLEKIGEKYKIGGDVLQYLTKKDLIAKVFDAYRSEATTKGVVSVEVAQALRELNNSVLRLFRHYGVTVPDLGEYFFTHQIHDATKMSTPNTQLLADVLGLSPEEVRRATGSTANLPAPNLAKKLWKTFTLNKIDWEKSFEGSKKETRGERMKLLEDMWQEVMGLATSGERPGVFRPNSFASWVKGKQRQIFFTDGDAYAEYQTHYGTANLINHIDNMVTSSSKNLAVFSKFGPNPEYVFGKVMERLKEMNPDTLKTSKELAKMQGWFDHFTKHVNAKVDLNAQAIAQIAKFVPGAKVAFSLGLNSTPDFYLMQANLQSMKLDRPSQHVVKSMGDFFFRRLGSDQNRELQKKFSNVNHHFSQALLYQSKIADVRAGLPGAKTRKLAYQFGSWGGIHSLDLSIKLGTKLAYAETVASNRNVGFESLPLELKLKLRQHQFSPAEWDGIRSESKNFAANGEYMMFAPLEVGKMSDSAIANIYGIKPTSKITIQSLRNDLTMKSAAFINHQANYVIPEMNAPVERLTKQIMSSSFVQEHPSALVAFQMMYQFKNWSLNFVMTTLKRIVYQKHKTYPQRVWDMATLMLPLGGIYALINHMSLVASNKKQPWKKHATFAEKALTVGGEVFESALGQLGVMNLIFSQFSTHPRNLFPSVSFFGHLGRSAFGAAFPSKTHTHGDYLARIMGEVADTNVITEAFYNYLVRHHLDSRREESRITGE
jgi:predicted metalloenzyme YecM